MADTAAPRLVVPEPASAVRAVAALAVAASLLGCSILPGYTHANRPLADHVPPPTRASLVLDVTRRPFPPSRAFVGIAMSGGGSRAANFSAAALFALEELGFLRHAAALSAVSGSSLAVAYYGLAGPEPGRWEPTTVQALLRTDFEARWLVRWFWPQNILRYWLTDFDRSDIMTRVFDQVLFRGATFAAMGGIDAGPRIFLNATDFTGLQRFTFTDQAFAAMGSRLDAYPLSHAVMASGAFPGVFANVTLRDFRASEPGRYAHLLDGGPTDNLGVSTLLEIARELYRRPAAALRPSGCFFFIVDAYANTEYEEIRVRLSESGGDPSALPGSRQRDTRTALGYFIDTNALAAANVLLYHSRLNLLREVGIDATRSWQAPVHEFPLFPDGEAGAVACLAWHVTFDRLLAGELAGEGPGTRAADVASIVKRIQTRYALIGPDGRTPEELQAALFEAARLLLREDRPALARACGWFAAHGLGALTGCRPGS